MDLENVEGKAQIEDSVGIGFQNHVPFSPGAHYWFKLYNTYTFSKLKA